jgi:hypothetical protein
VKRWYLGPAVLAGVLATVVYGLDRLLAVDPVDALVDATVAGFVIWLILAYWRR